MEQLAINLSHRRVRSEELGGRQYLVAPLTLIVPGVLHGSKGALYYPPDEIAKDPSVWNHVPLVVYHPNIDGQHVTARSPAILDKQGIGVVLNARISKRGTLQAEGWFDIERTKAVDERVYLSLMAGKPIELSTGLYTENEEAPAGASFNGRSYSYVARNYKPDHLAILPDQVGACSIKDGCGVLVNQYDPTIVWNKLAKLLNLNEEWITISGTHVLIKDGESKDSAAKGFIDRKEGRVGKLGPRTKANKVGDRGIALSRQADKAKAGASAAKAHSAASKQHERAAKAYEKAGDKVAAGYHTQLARQHADEATKHKTAATAAPKAKKAKALAQKGIEASKKADKAAEGRPAAKLQAAAAKAHMRASKAFTAAGDKEGALAHAKLSGQHAGRATTQSKLHKQGLALPKSSSKLTIPQATFALSKKGYKLGKGDYDVKTGKMTYEVTHEKSGKKHVVEASRIKELLYKKKPTYNERQIMGETRQLWRKLGKLLGVTSSQEELAVNDDLFEPLPVANGDQPNGPKQKPKRQRTKAKPTGKPSNTTTISNQDQGVPKMAKMSDADRKAVIDGLVGNACCWTEADRPVLNGASDETLVKLRDQAAKDKQNEAIANAAREGFTGKKVTDNELPAALKEALDKKKAAAVKGGEEEEEEEVVEEKVKNKKPGCNQAQTEEEWLKAAPASVQNTLAYARQIEERERQTIIGKLTANVAADKRQALAARLATKPLDELNDLLVLAPAPAVNMQARPNYVGAAAPVSNASADLDDGDYLPVPTMDYAKK